MLVHVLRVRNAESLRVEKEAIYTGKRDTASEESKAKERESDRLTKKRCIQGEFSGDKKDKRLV